MSTLISDVPGFVHARLSGGNKGTAWIIAAGSDSPENVEGRLSIVNALLDAGADVNAKDRFERTALHWAVQTKKLIDIVRALLAADGIKVDARDSRKRTALMEASECGHVDMVRALVGKGADMTAKDMNGNTALWHASKSYNGEYEEVRKYLETQQRRRRAAIALALNRTSLPREMQLMLADATQMQPLH